MLPIYVDLDDVLADTTKSYVKIVRREFGKKILFEDVFSFDLKVSFRLTDREFESFFRMAHQPEVLMEIAPIEGAIRTLEQWVRIGYKVWIVTGRLTIAYDASIEWLAKHHVPHDSFVMLDKYARDNVDHNIAMSMEDFSEKNFCLAIEDSVDMAKYLSNKMKIPVAMVTRPWNQKAALSEKINRYESWGEILKDYPSP